MAVACYVFSSCTTVAPDWRHDEPGEAHELAQAVCDEVLAVEADPARARQLAAMLGDRRIVYTEVDPDGARIEVTARDVAFTILEEAGVIDDRVDRKLKLLHGCQAGDEWVPGVKQRRTHTVGTEASRHFVEKKGGRQIS